MLIYRDVPDLSASLQKNIKRLPIVLCEDISGSMEAKRDLMNRHLEKFFRIKELEPETCKRTDITILCFNETVHEPICSSLDTYEFKEFGPNIMSGTTHLWSALGKALELCERYISAPEYWTPWILLYTDGFPNDEPEDTKNQVIQKLQKYEKDNKIVLFILGIGDKNGNIENLNVDVLNNISKRGSRVVLYARNQDVDISCFFQFMMRTITKTLGSVSYFIKNSDGTYKLNVERIYEAFEARKQWI